MIDKNSTNYKIQDLFETLLNDEEFDPDPAVRKRAVALMRGYSSSF